MATGARKGAHDILPSASRHSAAEKVRPVVSVSALATGRSILFYLYDDDNTAHKIRQPPAHDHSAATSTVTAMPTITPVKNWLAPAVCRARTVARLQAKRHIGLLTVLTGITVRAIITVSNQKLTRCNRRRPS